MTKKVREAVKGARTAGLEVVGEARAQLAVELAKTLDEGAGLATAAVARELRVTLGELPIPSDEGSAVANDR